MNVLLAVDETNFARAIAEFVGNHSWPPDTFFTVLSIVKPTKVCNALAVLPGPLLEIIEVAQLESARDLVSTTAKSVRQKLPDFEVKELVVLGFPDEDIARYAREEGVDLVVMGSHGRGELGRVILGSVSMSVMTHAPCSVAIVRLEHMSKIDEATAEEVAGSETHPAAKL